MSLGSKKEYVCFGNLRPSRLWNVARGLLRDRNGRLPYYPRRYSIEPTTMCNLRCPYCMHTDYDERVHLKRESLRLEQFKVIFERISRYALMIEFYNFGEPFLNKDTPAMIAMATRHGIPSRVSSNMSVPLSDDYARRIVESGLRRLTCSIDGPTQEVYEKYRVGGSLETVLQNVDKILFYRQNLKSQYPKVIYRMLLFEWNYTCVDASRRLAGEHHFDAFYEDPGSFDFDGRTVIWDAAAADWRSKQPKFLDHIPEKAPHPCQWLFTGMIVNANGKVMPCCYCNTQAAEHLSLLENSLEDVWNSETYVNTRRYTLGLSKDRSNVFPVCRQCRLL